MYRMFCMRFFSYYVAGTFPSGCGHRGRQLSFERLYSMSWFLNHFPTGHRFFLVFPLLWTVKANSRKVQEAHDWSISSTTCFQSKVLFYLFIWFSQKHYQRGDNPIYNQENEFVVRDKLPQDPTARGRGGLGQSPRVTFVMLWNRGRAGDAREWKESHLR